MGKYLFRWFLIFIVITLAASGITAVYCIFASHNLKAEYETVYQSALDFSCAALEEKTALAYTALDAAGENEVPQGYSGVGELIAEDNLYRLRYYGGDYPKTEELTLKNYEKAAGIDRGAGAPVNVISRGTYFGKDLILFAKKETTRYRVIYQEYSDFIDELAVSVFDNVFLADDNGLLISSVYHTGKTTLDRILGTAYAEPSAITGPAYTDYNGGKYFVLVKEITLPGHYLVGLKSASHVQEEIRFATQRAVIFAAALAAATYVGSVIAILVYVYLNNKNLAGSFMRGKYLAVIDVRGKVKRRNAQFKNSFDIKDILDSIVDTGTDIVNALNNNGDITVKMKDKEGSERYIRFMTSPVLSGYKLVGTDVTTFMNSYNEAKYLAGCDYNTHLPNYDRLLTDYTDFLNKYPDENFCLAVIDLTGTEKMSLPYAVSKFFANNASIVSVQPSWRDRAELVGYLNEFTKKFNETDFLASLYEATYRDDVNLIVLDEMNLARIEYYFAEFLSIMEMPDTAEWKIELVPSQEAGDPKNIVDGKLLVPQNVWFVGTANQDDSTFTITDKVYDRAVAISLNEKGQYFDAPVTDTVNISYDYLQSLYDKAIAENPLSAKATEKLNKLDEFIQTKFKIAFGNRILKQIRLFVPVYVAEGGSENEGLDFMVTTKILKKFNSLNLVFLTKELTELIALIEKLFGKDQFPMAVAYLKQLQKNV